ncbi:hypothetical protein CDL15_Pgr008794 [Punica granatum]|uniref:Uncharacterized protein n=1 Tax=Punica granatum TaxID=22663 RepID=A0A218VXJ9_PUNGR|nr:hypothetical protein CDL15_Pgr008794 [Punica granatum]
MGSLLKHPIVPMVVALSNALADNLATLGVHCRRVDNGHEEDLRPHDVALDSHYEFRFGTMTTAYNCS